MLTDCALTSDKMGCDFKVKNNDKQICIFLSFSAVYIYIYICQLFEKCVFCIEACCLHLRYMFHNEYYPHYYSKWLW
jgi:hypothetical protein